MFPKLRKESFNCPEVECDFQFEVTEGGFIMTVTEVQSVRTLRWLFDDFIALQKAVAK